MRFAVVRSAAAAERPVVDSAGAETVAVAAELGTGLAVVTDLAGLSCSSSEGCHPAFAVAVAGLR